jgi:hypothetical protein
MKGPWFLLGEHGVVGVLEKEHKRTIERMQSSQL